MLLENQKKPLNVKVMLDDQHRVHSSIPFCDSELNDLDRAVVYHIASEEVVSLDRLAEVDA